MEKVLKKTIEYKGISKEEALSELEGSLKGLSTTEAQKRIKKYGTNEISEKKSNMIIEFLKRYWGPMPWLLEFAIILTMLLGRYIESIIIFTLLSLNAVIGYHQNRTSKKAVDMLKKRLEINTKVLRDGSWQQLEAKEIVPGDIVILKIGDFVPADAYILKGQISADESALTGESLPKNLNQKDTVFSGSIIKRGEARCLIVNTGANTYFGKIVELVKIARPKSKQQELMLNIVKYMMYLGIAASVAVSIYAIYLEKDILFILSFIVIFMIGSIPVALPAVFTIVQAVGATELSKKGILATRLDAIEDAASIDIFCFDKTGTITQNKLSVVESLAFGEYTNDQVARMAALASSKEGMDALDMAIIDYSIEKRISLEGYSQITYTPFDPKIKKTEATVETDEGKRIRIIKGEAGTIASLCQYLEDITKEKLKEAVEKYSRKGSRIIAVAVEEDETMKLAGVLAIADPPRADSKSMIAEIGELGIKSIMITGDSKAIAREIAGNTGIGSRILSIGELKNLSHEDQLKKIMDNDGFAEVYPEDKYKIVKLLQESGHMVGMTGDGVNDSPALKQAELGTAVSQAADVAKASASIVLTQPGLREIIDALKISRKTYQRMLTWVINKITKVVEVVVLFSVGFFWLHDLVVSLLGMSLLVFANDFVTMSIATDKVKSTDSPNIWEIRKITAASLLLGFLFALEDLFIIYLGIHVFRLGFIELQTLVLLSLVFNTQFRILIVRERKHFWSSAPSWKLLIVNILTIIGFIIIGAMGTFVPKLDIGTILILLGLTALFMVVIDFIKYHLFVRLKV